VPLVDALSMESDRELHTLKRAASVGPEETNGKKNLREVPSDSIAICTCEAPGSFTCGGRAWLILGSGKQLHYCHNHRHQKGGPKRFREAATREIHAVLSCGCRSPGVCTAKAGMPCSMARYRILLAVFLRIVHIVLVLVPVMLLLQGGYR
jgi:hypothetical protein